jgi:hypothetical protein
MGAWGLRVAAAWAWTREQRTTPLLTEAATQQAPSTAPLNGVSRAPHWVTGRGRHRRDAGRLQVMRQRRRKPA